LLLCPLAQAASSTSTYTGQIPIKHLFIIMQENHTFDNYFGTYPGANGIQNAVPQRAPNGTLIKPFEINTTEIPTVPNLLCHAASCARAAYDGGKMDGFVMPKAENTTQTMGYFNPKLIAYYWDYASQYVLLDNLYSSFMGPSFPNHIYMLAGQSGGVTGDNYSATFSFPTIVQELESKNVSWAYYAGGHIGPNGWNPLPSDIPYRDTHPQLQGLRESVDFPADVARPGFPSVVWIMPEQDNLSEHPPYNVTAGEMTVVNEINDIMKSQYWNSSAIFVTWDDYGGWYDHMAPPQVDQYGFGFRVPGLIISPFAKHGYIDSTMNEFTSTLKLIETIYHLPSMTARDANANGLLEAFDFNQIPRSSLVLPGPFQPDHYPLVYPNGTLYKGTQEMAPGSSLRLPSGTDLELTAALVAVVVMLIVVVTGAAPKRMEAEAWSPPSGTQ
jgi:phospholipase C